MWYRFDLLSGKRRTSGFIVFDPHRLIFVSMWSISGVSRIPESETSSSAFKHRNISMSWHKNTHLNYSMTGILLLTYYVRSLINIAKHTHITWAHYFANTHHLIISDLHIVPLSRYTLIGSTGCRYSDPLFWNSLLDSLRSIDTFPLSCPISKLMCCAEFDF